MKNKKLILSIRATVSEVLEKFEMSLKISISTFNSISVGLKNEYEKKGDYTMIEKYFS